MKKYIITIVLAIIIVGIIIGYNNQIDLSSIVSLNFTFKYFFYILVICASGMVLSYIGVPLFLVFLFFDLFSCGIVTSYFLLAFSFKGVIFSLLYIFIFKIIFWFLLLLNSFYSIKLIKNNYKYLFRRYRENKNNSKLYFKKMLIINIFILGVNFITVLFGDKVVNYFGNYLLW